jgi:anthranilate phosphoribosyltransferase
VLTSPVDVHSPSCLFFVAKQLWELKDGQIRHRLISPASFGLSSHPLSHVCSYSASENAAIVLRMLSSAEASLPSAPLSAPEELGEAERGGRDLPPIPKGARLRALADYTLLQAAALLHVAGHGKTLPESVELARTSMRSGAARTALEAFRRTSQEAVANEEHKVKAQEQEEEQRSRREEDLKKEREGDEFYYAPGRTRDMAVGTE